MSRIVAIVQGDVVRFGRLGSSSFDDALDMRTFAQQYVQTLLVMPYEKQAGASNLVIGCSYDEVDRLMIDVKKGVVVRVRPLNEEERVSLASLITAELRLQQKASDPHKR